MTYTTQPKRYAPAEKITATVTTERGYFSITGEIRNSSPEHRRDPIVTCGCIHEDIAKHFPELVPFIRLHLSRADTGEPRHALENGLYWLQGAAEIPAQYGPDQTPDQCRAILAAHLRTDDATTAAHIDAARAAYAAGRATIATSEDVTPQTRATQHKAGASYVRTYFTQAIKDHRAQWQAEADAGRALLESLTV